MLRYSELCYSTADPLALSCSKNGSSRPNSEAGHGKSGEIFPIRPGDELLVEPLRVDIWIDGFGNAVRT
jgi:hypothetical protein